MGDGSGDGGFPKKEKSQLDKAENGCIRNARTFIYLSAPSLVALFISFSFRAPPWFQTAGLIGMTLGMLFWCNATRHLLKYIKIKKENR